MSARIFIHGLEGSDQGTKAVFFKEKYPDMIIPHFVGDLGERMKTLSRILAGKSGIILVGSSFGGLMAFVFAMDNETRVDRLILLAPAIHLMAATDYADRRLSRPVWVYHGQYDEVIPLKEVEAVARRAFSNLAFHVAEDDHSLHRTFGHLPWDRLLALDSPPPGGDPLS
jgi:pimeloyl-ACP methyl ester carboxylesterase